VAPTPREKLTIAEVLDALGQRPSRIAQLTSGLGRRQLRESPRPGAWSASDLLAHLRCCSDAWGGAIATMLAEDHPTIKAVNPRLLMRSCDYARRPFATSLAAFGEQRTELLAVLEGLDGADWRRGATVVGAGAPLERTVRRYATWLARHERTHDRQFAQIARQLVGEGPGSASARR
jgi:hypothetical protein